MGVQGRLKTGAETVSRDCKWRIVPFTETVRALSNSHSPLFRGRAVPSKRNSLKEGLPGFDLFHSVLVHQYLGTDDLPPMA